MLGTFISAGLTASIPPTRENGVSPIAVLEVVLYPYRTPGISSAQPRFLLSMPFL